MGLRGGNRGRRAGSARQAGRWPVPRGRHRHDDAARRWGRVAQAAESPRRRAAGDRPDRVWEPGNGGGHGPRPGRVLVPGKAGAVAGAEVAAGARRGAGPSGGTRRAPGTPAQLPGRAGRDGGRFAENAGSLRPDPSSGAQPGGRADHRRKRHGKGTGGARDSHAQPAQGRTLRGRSIARPCRTR